MLSAQASCLEIHAFVNVTSFFLFKERERRKRAKGGEGGGGRGKEVSES